MIPNFSAYISSNPQFDSLLVPIGNQYIEQTMAGPCSYPLNCTPLPTTFPGPPPTDPFTAGVKCGLIPPSTCRKSFDLRQTPKFALDHKAPIEIQWPPDTPQNDPCDDVDTGPRPDLLALIPDQIVPQQVVTMNFKGDLAHPLCPDSSFHMRIQPKGPPPKTRYVVPDLPCPLRGPQRPWVQCVENTLINDQVRRPLARCCHKRPLPPFVLSNQYVESLKAKITEKERLAAEKEARMEERECRRLRARERQGKWNYTVESLLDRKQAKERERDEAEKEATRQLLQEMEDNNKKQSAETIGRANKMMLYRKGLIRDFHAALGYSKMMQDVEEAQGTGTGKECPDESCCPLFVQRCYKKMMYPNESRPDYAAQPKPKAEVNPLLLEKWQSIERRRMEHKEEQNAELCKLKNFLDENKPELSAAYKKIHAWPVCEETDAKHEKRANELFSTISDKLAVDAYIENYEKEVERQACEFENYKRQVDAIKKAKEKQLIDEKVAYNIRKSEEAAKALVATQAAIAKKKLERKGGSYEELREKWESEIEDQERRKKRDWERLMDNVASDYIRRRRDEEWSKCGLHPAREWAKERLVAEENFEMECDVKTKKREVEEDLMLFNRAMASQKKCEGERKKYMDHVWAKKMKDEYVKEMREMQKYAKECIKDWEAKGRSAHPMHQAMKKWEYDSDMRPDLFLEPDEVIKRKLEASGHMKPTEITSKRLGFGSGGCS